MVQVVNEHQLLTNRLALQLFLYKFVLCAQHGAEQAATKSNRRESSRSFNGAGRTQHRGASGQLQWHKDPAMHPIRDHGMAIEMSRRV